MILCIYGAGGFGKEVSDIALRINKKHARWEEIYFIDDFPKIGNTYNGINISSFSRLLEKIDNKNIEFIVSIGEPSIRKKIYNKIKLHNLKITTLIDPNALVSDTAKIGDGVIVFPFSVISSSTEIMENVSVNTHTTIGHDILIESHSVISSNVTIGGNNKIGTETFIGLGVQTKENLNIGSEVIIGMGAIVFADIDNCMIAMGNPARPIRRNIDKRVFSS
jgi:sugar O-acyltransferase (sialic acid O-acetyltransferase NeuD family)